MKVIKYCGICGNEIEIDYEPRQVVKTVCSKCKTETDWKFFNNGNFDTISYLKEEVIEIHDRMKRA